MRGSGGKEQVCFESLETALAESPEAYGHLDLIAFGFPCQDISIANKKREGLKGERSSVFWECMRIVHILLPQWILIENVPALRSINEGRDMSTVLQSLAESGYGWAYRVLDSRYFGLAQRRKRVFIIGCLGRIPPPEILFERESNSGIIKKGRKKREQGLCISAREGQRHTPHAETYIAHTVQAAKRGDALHFWGESFIAEIDSKGEGTVARIPGELDSARTMLIGNAVSVPVAEWLGRRITTYSGRRAT